MSIKMVKAKRVGITILAVALTALLLFTACAPAAQPAAGKKVVRIGMIAPFTGGAAEPIQQSWRNLVDYLKYFEEKGIPGVTFPPGVTIELRWGDTAFQEANAIGVYEGMRDQDIVFFYTPSPLEGEALKSRFERDEVPAIVMALSEDMVYPPGWIFSIYPTESERFAVVCDWIRENWKEERPPRVAIMGTDTPSGRAPEVMGTKYAQSIGVEMLPFEVVPYVPLDVTTQLLRLRDEGADFVYIQGIVSTAAAVMRDAQRLGLTDKIRFGGMENSQSTTLLELGPVAEGFFAARAEPWYEEVPILKDVLREYRGKLDTEGSSGPGTLLFASAMINAIRIAIDNVGYENLDGSAVKEAMYSIKDFDPYAMGRKLTYTPEDNRGTPVVRMYQVQGGQVVPVADWREAPMLVP